MVELSNDELVCVAQHLIAQHRQAMFNRKSKVSEACEKCPIRSKCFNNLKENGSLWGNTYKKICNAANIEYSFFIGKYPMVPYKKEDIR